jgi:hypothetical protein
MMPKRESFNHGFARPPGQSLPWAFRRHDHPWRWFRGREEEFGRGCTRVHVDDHQYFISGISNCHASREIPASA